MIQRVLIVHNGYQHKGGEDTVVEAEVQLLRERGHAVALFTRHNDDIHKVSKLALVANTFWASGVAAEFAAELERFKPDVIHVHNIFPMISPAIYWVAAKHHIPVVQTLHNFRLLCPQAMFLREGKVCEACMGCVPWRGVVHGCYRDSKVQSAVLAGMVSFHRLLGTWQEKVTRYIALNDFCRSKYINGGLPADKLVIKPNFVQSIALSTNSPIPNGVLYVGRLSPEKGINVLAKACAPLSMLKVKVAGTGEQSTLLEKLENVELLGLQSPEAVRQLMAQSIALVMPSICFETFGLVIIEAFSVGTPVIASRIGVLPELVEDGVTGLLFNPGDADDLADKLQWAQAHPEQMRSMGEAARAKYEAFYTAETNYQQLMTIYRDAIAEVQGVKVNG